MTVCSVRGTMQGRHPSDSFVCVVCVCVFVCVKRDGDEACSYKCTIVFKRWEMQVHCLHEQNKKRSP